MPLHAEAPINSRLIQLAIDYLHTRDPQYFPFAAEFDDARREAFVRDLRIGLSDINESGAKRGTSSTGFITSDKRLQEIVREWAEAEGGLPKGQEPTNPDGVAPLARILGDSADEAPAGIEERD